MSPGSLKSHNPSDKSTTAMVLSLLESGPPERALLRLAKDHAKPEVTQQTSPFKQKQIVWVCVLATGA